MINQDGPNSRMPILVLSIITLVNTAIVVNFLFFGLMDNVLVAGTFYIYALVAIELVCVYLAWTRGRRGYRGASI